MTRDEAIAELTAYRQSIQGLFVLVAIGGMAFGKVGPEVEAALGIPSGALAKALDPQALTDAMSAYTTVLENAAKGQLASESTTDEWESVINAD